MRNERLEELAETLMTLCQDRCPSLADAQDWALRENVNHTESAELARILRHAMKTATYVRSHLPFPERPDEAATATAAEIEAAIERGILWRCDCGLVLGGGSPCPRCEG